MRRSMLRSGPRMVAHGPRRWISACVCMMAIKRSWRKDVHGRLSRDNANRGFNDVSDISEVGGARTIPNGKKTSDVQGQGSLEDHKRALHPRATDLMSSSLRDIEKAIAGHFERHWLLAVLRASGLVGRLSRSARKVNTSQCCSLLRFRASYSEQLVLSNTEMPSR